MRRLLALLLLLASFGAQAFDHVAAVSLPWPGPGTAHSTGGGGGGGSIAVGQHDSAWNATVATTPAHTTQAAGSTFVVWASYGSAGSVAITDSKLNAYTQILTTETSGGGSTGVMYYCSNCTGGASHTATCTLTGGDSFGVACFFLEITGAQTSSFDSGSAVILNTDVSSPFAVTSNALSQAVELVVCGISGDSGSNPATLAISGGDSFIIQDHLDNGTIQWVGGLATLITSSSTAKTCSMTQSGTGNVVQLISGFKQ